MSGKNIIQRVDGGNETFQKTFRKLKPQQIKEASAAFGLLFMLDTDMAPAKLHFHPLKDMQVPSVLDPSKKVKVYTIHITSDDSYKASFTLEDGTAYLRACGEHDGIDKNP
jgi:hypothetical protein